MAKSSIPTPDKMDMQGDFASNWEFFKDSWLNFVTATELNKKSDTVVVATLLSIMGKECYKVYKNLPMTDDERKSSKIILDKLTVEFEGKKNIIYERYAFNSRAQKPDESFDRYLTRLRELIATCKYGTLENEMLRDRIVIGIKNSETQQRLLREKDLTLDEAVNICRSSEMAAQHSEKFEHIPEAVNYVKNKPRTTQKSDSRFIKSCRYCGGQHRRGKCPAYGETCSNCQKENHLAKVCMSPQTNESTKPRQQKQSATKSSKPGRWNNQIHQLEDGNTSSSEEHIWDSDESIYSLQNKNEKRKFCAKVMVKADDSKEPQPIIFQLDTGASCSTISLKDYSQITKQTPQPSLTKLKLYDQSTLKPVGQTKLRCTANGITIKIHFEIVKDGPVSLLSGRACEALQLLHFSENILNVNAPLTKEQIFHDYADVFTGLGKLPGVYHIETDPNVKPTQSNPRRVPIPVQEELKDKIDELEQIGVLAKVTEPTQWISNMVVVRKPNKLRVCIDPLELNKAIIRNHYPTPTIDEVAPKLTNAKVFSVVDAKDGFLQVKLDEPSSYLTTFWTPHGRYRWLRMPFGIKSAPEEFQRRLDDCIEGLPNIQAVHDDIIVYGADENEHDSALNALLRRCRERGLKLNKRKLKYKLDKVAYLGHILTPEGIAVDPEKVCAIVDMPQPKDVQGVQRLIGVVTYLSKFLPQLSTVAEPLRRLTDKDSAFDWLPQHEAAFSKIKTMITQTPILRYYDVNKDVSIECDSSDVGLGAVITQEGKPIAYASRALTQTERNYAQIEKECLAIVFATHRFEHYILGKDNVRVYTDHKPLVTIFKKTILTSPKRLQRMRLRLQKYSLDLEYKPGPTMYISDTLSRASLPIKQVDKDTPSYQIFQIQEEQELHGELEDIDLEDSLFVTDTRLNTIKHETAKDMTLQTLMNVTKGGWPANKLEVPLCIREYWPYRDELTTQNGLAYRGTRIIIPTAMRAELTNRAHASHLGIQYTCNTARPIMYWPRMTADLTDAVNRCETCQTTQPAAPKEPLMTHPIPQIPWQSVASDCFELDGHHYVVLVDLYSDYIEVAELLNMTTTALIKQMKPIFATHGSPAVLITDNGSNYASQEFKSFTKDWEIHHVTTSPHHHKANGKAESAVKIMKNIIKKARKEKQDMWKAILEWRNSPTPGTTNSPAQKLMSRRTRSFLPCAHNMYKPVVQTNVTEQVVQKRKLAKLYHDRSAKPLPKLICGQPVMVKVHPQQPRSDWKAGMVKQQTTSPRSYIVAVNGRNYKRNRTHLKDTKVSLTQSSNAPQLSHPLEDTAPKPTSKASESAVTFTESTTSTKPTPSYTTMSGRTVKPPLRLSDSV